VVGVRANIFGLDENIRCGNFCFLSAFNPAGLTAFNTDFSRLSELLTRKMP